MAKNEWVWRRQKVVDALRLRWQDAVEAFETQYNAAWDRVVAEWLAKRGCEKCGGYGQVLTWSTLDGESYDEHTSCGCGSVGPRTRPDWLGPPRSRGHHVFRSMQRLEQYLPAEEFRQLVRLDTAKELAASEVLELNRTPRRGDVVLVYKGRKVPTDIYGVLVSIKSGQYGTRGGVFATDGNVYWTALSNLCIGTGILEKEEIGDLMVLRMHTEGEFKQQQAAKLEALGANDLPRLRGSERQVDWALKLRLQALLSGKVTSVEARRELDSRWWIDHR